MKKFLFMCMMALGCMTAFTACGDDDDDPVIEDVQGGGGKVSTSNLKIEDNGNQLVGSFDMSAAGATINVKITATFQNERCVSMIEELTYPSESMAKASLAGYQKDGEKVTLKGRTITVDVSEDCAGFDKNMVRTMIEAMYKGMSAQQ